MSTPERMPTLPVHIESSDVPFGPGRRPRLHKAATFRTIMVSASEPVRPLAAQDLTRKTIMVQAAGNPVVLCASKSDAKNGEGTLLPPASPGSALSGYGSVPEPTAAETIASLTLPFPGAWQVQVLADYAGTLTTADIDNMELFLGTTLVSRLLTNITTASSAQNQPLQFFVADPTGQVLTVQAVANSSAAAIYRALILAFPAAGADTWLELDTTEQVWITAKQFPAWVTAAIINAAPED